MKLIIDKQELTFQNAKEAVEYMNSTAFQPSASAEHYMVDYAVRAATYDGSLIASHSWEAFIECLLFKQHIRAV